MGDGMGRRERRDGEKRAKRTGGSLHTLVHSPDDRPILEFVSLSLWRYAVLLQNNFCIRQQI